MDARTQETATIPERPTPRQGAPDRPLEFSAEKFRAAWDEVKDDPTLVPRMMLATEVKSVQTLKNWALGRTVPDANQAVALAGVFGKKNPLFFFA